MSTTGNNTLDRIQKEIKESLQREDELRNIYGLQNNNNYKIINNNNGIVESTDEKPSTTVPVIESGNIPNSNQKLNGSRLFTPNAPTKGLMQKFLKMRGRISIPAVQQNQQQNNWAYSDVFEPAKVTVQKGKPARNGFVSAEEKMRRELEEFQLREAELRKERRKSQPDLMANLDDQLDIENTFKVSTNLKTTKSMANICSADSDDMDFQDNNHSSAPCSLKPARSLAALCDISDEELEMPGTYSLIMQFEKMKNQQVRS